MTQPNTQAVARLKARFPSRNPNKKAAAETKVSRDLCEHIAAGCLERGPMKAARWLQRSILPGIPAGDFRKELQKAIPRLRALARGVFAFEGIFNEDGNTKLPFCAFSSLPGHDCPGAGACLNWCYSFKGWRYPAVFFRQLYNSMALRFQKRAIREAFLDLPENITFRLYVDGDFASPLIARWWFNLLRKRPDIKTYGYSKSWAILVKLWNDGFPFPSNYRLNLSNGGKDEHLRPQMLEIKRENGMPLVRGDFVVVGVSGDFPRGEERYNHQEYHRAVRESAAAQGLGKVFSCPGKCGECGASEHICGSDKATGVVVAIGIH